MKKLRAKKKEEEKKLTGKQLQRAIAERRKAVRKRVQKHRARAKTRNDTPTDDQSVSSRSTRLSEISSQSYSCRQTLGKAVKKVVKQLLASPRKQKAILAHIVANLNEADKLDIANVIANPSRKKKSLQDQLSDDCRKFFVRDDISRVSPKTRDVKKYKCPETGQEMLMPTRHMTLSLKEAYALFVEERKNQELGMFVLSIDIKFFIVQFHNNLQILNISNLIISFRFILRCLRLNSFLKTTPAKC
jgi:hypothetical protein